VSAQETILLSTRTFAKRKHTGKHRGNQTELTKQALPLKQKKMGAKKSKML
jgi:hypothetical protein